MSENTLSVSRLYTYEEESTQDNTEVIFANCCCLLIFQMDTSPK